VAGGLFAQLTIGGGVSAGLEVAIEDDVTFHVYDNPDNSGGYRLSLSASYKTEGGKVGADGDLKLNTGSLEIGNSSAWFKPLDILTVTVGKFGFWRGTPGSIGSNNGNDNGNGVYLYLEPLAGLYLGTGIYPQASELGDTKLGLYARYQADGLVNVVANGLYDGTGNDGDGQFNVGAGVDVLALASMGLTKIAVDFQATNLTKLSTAGAVTIGPRVNFKVSDLSGYVRAELGVPVQSEETRPLNVRARAGVSYPITSAITAALDAGYTLKGAVSDTTGNAFDYRLQNTPGSGLSAADTSVVGVGPSVTFNIDGKSLVVAYGLQTQLGGASKTKHAIATNFNVGF